MAGETAEQRRKREGQRLLFNTVAELYEATRRGYPAEIIDAMLATAAVGPAAAVLEIGCGTGQLTRQLAGRGLDLTAIDVGPAMVDMARRTVAEPAVRFHVTAFEDFRDGKAFDLVVSATAFHWVDPVTGLVRAARLLRPGGWLALLSTGERYAEPLRSQLRDLWTRYSRRAGEWADQPPWLAALRETALFGPVVEASHEAALRLPARTVCGVERTRATFLSYSPADQARFAAELDGLLQGTPQVDLVQHTVLAMAPVAG